MRGVKIYCLLDDMRVRVKYSHIYEYLRVSNSRENIPKSCDKDELAAKFV